jgi:hypothetical protein
VGCSSSSICFIHAVRLFYLVSLADVMRSRDYLRHFINIVPRYGIEGIAQTYEDPFGIHKIDIRMNDIVEDARRETEVLLSVWEIQSHGRGHDHGYNGCNMFVPLTRPSSSSSGNSGSCDREYGNGKSGQRGAIGVKWAESDIFRRSS